MTAPEYIGGLPYERVELKNDPRRELIHPILRRLHAYWETKRELRIGPSRSDIDPVDFPYAIGWVSLFDVSEGPDNFIIRVLGGRSERTLDLGPDFRRPQDSDDPEFHAVAMEDLRWVVEHRKPLRVFRDIKTAKRRYRFEGLVLPLSDDGQHVNMLLLAGIPPVGG
ncbi:PAS domain-containing protein [Ferrovibrio sp.]|uniref:PAS domain-containing protein n=1 Tax=Ferrovibrio sp. TaxID=1917215 RepID=UPI0035B11477